MTSSLEFHHWYGASISGLYSHSIVAHYLFGEKTKKNDLYGFELEKIQPQLEQNGFAFHPVVTWTCSVWKEEEMKGILQNLAFEGTDLARDVHSNLKIFVDTNRIKEYQNPSFVTKCTSDKTFEQDEQERRLLGVGLGHTFIPRVNDTYRKFVEKSHIDIDDNFLKLQHPVYMICSSSRGLAITLLEVFFASDNDKIAWSGISVANCLLDPVLHRISEWGKLSYISY